MSDFETERKFSTPLEWRNSIDWDDAPDGSEGGYDRHGNFIIPEAMKELVILRARVERVERERDEALNELDAVYAALGTSDAEGAPEAAVTIESIFCERDALQARVERLEKALRAWIDATRMVVIDSRVRAEARAALAADGENNAIF